MTYCSTALRYLILATLLTLLALILFHGGSGEVPAMGQDMPTTTLAPPTTAPPCQEDDPCWDCATMGNLQCGPIPGEPTLIPAANIEAPGPIAALPPQAG
jgi:hypothetical protein